WRINMHKKKKKRDEKVIETSVEREGESVLVGGRFWGVGGSFWSDRGLARRIRRGPCSRYANQRAWHRRCCCRSSAYRHAARFGFSIFRLYRFSARPNSESSRKNSLYVWRQRKRPSCHSDTERFRNRGCGTTFPKPGSVAHTYSRP